MIVEEKNNIAKVKGETYLSGDEKKLSVVSRITEWVGNLNGSIENAVDFVEKNQRKIESIIDKYIICHISHITIDFVAYFYLDIREKM